MSAEVALPDDWPQQRAAIVRDSIGVALAVGTYGVSFGAVGVASGLSVAQACFMSLVMFTGASQFALAGVVAAGGSPVSGAATALLLGTRNTLYGLRMTRLLRWRGLKRVAAAHLLIDESTAMGVNRDSVPAARVGYLVTGLGILIWWNLTTAIGAVAGQQIGDPRTYGLDAAVGAAFLGLLWPRLTDATSRVVALLAVVVALGLVPITAVGVPVLAAGLVALVAGLVTGGRHPATPAPAPGQEDEVG